MAKPVVAPSQQAPRTRLNLTLTGLLASTTPDRSIAIILNGGDEQGYGEGDIVNGTQAMISSIMADRVILDNQGQSETLMLDGEEFKPVGQVTPQPQEVTTPPLSKLRDNLAKDPGKLLDYINISPVMADGKLTIEDIWGLPLNGTSLATLSACDTGMGEILSGDDIVSLENAFIYAGTPSVVSTLWPVADDSTAKLMEHFYSNMSQGKGKADALRVAQLAMIRLGKTTGRRQPVTWSHPYFWAPFMLRGEWR